MRFLTLVAPALLAASTHAASEAPEDTPSGSSSAAEAAPSDPPPVGSLWTATWDASTLSGYKQSCANKNTYSANIYKLSEMYPDLEKQAPQLKVFYNKQLYAGSWGGVDVHGTGRELIRMDMSDMPYKVREWMKQNPRQRHFSVQDSEVFFAPGAIYPILPLWVDDSEDPGCEDVFDELDTYSNEPKDGAVIGKVQHTSAGDKQVKFTVEALQVKAKAKSGGRDEL